MKDAVVNLIVNRHKLPLIFPHSNGELYVSDTINATILNKHERKKKGAFYTPIEIVEFIIELIKPQKEHIILEPSLGEGIFLYKILEYFKRVYGDNESIDYVKNLHGMENDSISVEIAKRKIFDSIFSNQGNGINNNQDKIHSIIDLVDTINKNIIKADFLTENIQNRFDIIIGNPPYIEVSLSKLRKSFEDKNINLDSIFEFGSGQKLNTSIIFTLKSIRLLKESGILAFVLPKTILYVHRYSSFRKYILENTTITNIIDIGSRFKGVRGEQIILVLRNEKPKQGCKISLSLLTNKNDNNYNSEFAVTGEINGCIESLLEEEKIIALEQNRFKNRICVLRNEIDYKILNKVEKILECKGKKLGELSNQRIYRGISINTRHMIPLRIKNVNEDKTKSEAVDYYKIISGKCIGKFHIKQFYQMKEQDIKPFGLKKKFLSNIRKPKIIIQNLFSSESGVIGTYDESGEFITTDTVTNIILDNKDLSKYILALLHSKLINYYLILGVYSLSRLTMHTDKSYIGEIPVVIDPKNFSKIVEIADKLLYSDATSTLKEWLKKIDKLVYSIYGLDLEEVSRVEEVMKSIISRRSLW